MATTIDFTKPEKTQNYDTGFMASVRANLLAAAMWLQPSEVTITGTPPTLAKRYNSAGLGDFEYYTGSAWAQLPLGFVRQVAPTTYGSVALPGATGSYAGIQFTGVTGLWTFMVHANGTSGLYGVTGAAWKWSFSDTGALATGSVPWGLVTGTPAITALTADVASSANTVARRDGSGYLFAVYLNQSSGLSENVTAQFMTNNGSDGYLRKTSLDQVGAVMVAASAAYLRQGGSRSGTAMSFTFSGNSGQPSWLWGSNDGVSCAVWNPSNFSVAYAATAPWSGISGKPTTTFTTTAGTPSGGSPGDRVLVY